MEELFKDGGFSKDAPHNSIVNYATGYILTEIGAGTKISSAVGSVISWSIGRGYQQGVADTQSNPESPNFYLVRFGFTGPGWVGHVALLGYQWENEKKRALTLEYPFVYKIRLYNQTYKKTYNSPEEFLADFEEAGISKEAYYIAGSGSMATPLPLPSRRPDRS